MIKLLFKILLFAMLIMFDMWWLIILISALSIATFIVRVIASTRE